MLAQECGRAEVLKQERVIWSLFELWAKPAVRQLVEPFSEDLSAIREQFSTAREMVRTAAPNT